MAKPDKEELKYTALKISESYDISLTKDNKKIQNVISVLAYEKELNKNPFEILLKLKVDYY